MALLNDLLLHEASCGFNQVTCMKRMVNKQEGNCKWSGCLNALGAHIRKNKCVVVSLPLLGLNAKFVFFTTSNHSSR